MKSRGKPGEKSEEAIVLKTIGPAAQLMRSPLARSTHSSLELVITRNFTDNMIEIIALETTQTAEAAKCLSKLIAAAWPSAERNKGHEVKIVPDARCYGEDFEDVDILVFAKFGYPLPSFILDNRPVYVRSLCLAIEVKNHSPSRVRFTGNKVEVEYRGRWEDASRQNLGQVYSVRNYIGRHGIRAPFVTNLLWLCNVPENQLPSTDHNIVGSDGEWKDFLSRGKFLKEPTKGGKGEEIKACRHYQDWQKAVAIFTRKMKPSSLDRQKMERVCQSFILRKIEEEFEDFVEWYEVGYTDSRASDMFCPAGSERS